MLREAWWQDRQGRDFISANYKVSRLEASLPSPSICNGEGSRQVPGTCFGMLGETERSQVSSPLKMGPGGGLGGV